MQTGHGPGKFQPDTRTRTSDAMKVSAFLPIRNLRPPGCLLLPTNARIYAAKGLPAGPL